MECRFLFFSLLFFFFFSCRESSRLSSGIQKYNKKQRKADGMRGTAGSRSLPLYFRERFLRFASEDSPSILPFSFHSIFAEEFLKQRKGRKDKIFIRKIYIQIVFPRDRFIRKILPNVRKVTRSSEF